MKIVIDAMGGDNAPRAIVEGAAQAAQAWPQVQFCLVGDEAAIKSCLPVQLHDRFEIVHTTQVIGTDEAPLVAIRKKKDSSLIVGLSMLRDKKADAFVSAGSTGAIMSAALFNVGRIKGVHRPALAVLLPTLTGEKTMVLDVGANAECKPEYFEQFAVMGTAYMTQVEGTANPTVGLINIGTEDEKGTAVYRQANQLLKGSQLNYCGNVEAREILAGRCSVAVCDGFAGNMVLKSTEGAASMILKSLKADVKKSIRAQLGALLMKNVFKNLKEKMDYNRYGGAPLLGIDGCVIKAHGSSGADALKAAVGQAIKYVEGRVTEKISAYLQETEPENN